MMAKSLAGYNNDVIKLYLCKVHFGISWGEKSKPLLYVISFCELFFFSRDQ